MIHVLAAVWLLAGDAASPAPSTEPAAEPALAFAPVPARRDGDPPAPMLPAVPDRGSPAPAPLPTVADEAPASFEITHAQLVRLGILPTTSTLAGLVAPLALGARGGDWGTPATEQLAGYGGAYGGVLATIGVTALIEGLGPAPKAEIGVNRAALGFAVLGIPLLTPAASGAAVWLAGEGMQGRSAHPEQNLLAAMGGGFAAELVYGAAAIALHQPAASTTNFVFVPIAVGATVAYDLARGPHRGPRRALMPMVTVRF